MKVDYLMDISEKSYSVEHTPSISSRRLPFFTHACGHFYANSSYFTTRAGLDNYLLIYTLSGRGYLEYNNTGYDLEPGQAVVFYCFEPQLYKSASQTPWEFLWIHFNGAMAKEFNELINGRSLQVISIGENQDIRKEFDAIFATLSEESVLKDVKINCQLTNMLTNVTICKHSPLNNQMYHQQKVMIDKVIAFIHENYHRKLSINDFVNLAHISKYYFIRLFKFFAGMSPYEYLISYRISIARALLRDTSLPVAEICSNVGFNDINNFTRYFKRFAGMTPASYRKKLGYTI